MSIPSATIMQFQLCVRVEECGETHPDWSLVGEGSVDKERAGEFDEVES